MVSETRIERVVLVEPFWLTIPLCFYAGHLTVGKSTALASTVLGTAAHLQPKIDIEINVELGL